MANPHDYAEMKALAEERLAMFRDGRMSVHDIGPPSRCETSSAIEAEQTLIAQYERVLGKRLPKDTA